MKQSGHGSPGRRRSVPILRGLLFLALLGAFPFCAGGAVQPDLWRKAVEIAAANQDWVPGEAYTRTELLDKKGKVQHVQESLLRLSLGSDGQIKTEIVRMVEDGKDKTAEIRKKQQEQKGDNNKGKHGFRIGRSPFLPRVQDSVTVWPLDSAVVFDGKRCLGFHFEQQVGPERTIVGTAWLDADSGVPVVLEFEPHPFPKRVKKLHRRIRYQYTADNGWYPVEMTTSGEASYLFVRKRFRSVVRLSKHWKLQEAE